MKLHKVMPALAVGDRVSAYNTLTGINMRGIIVDGEYSGGMLWCQVRFDDKITMWINEDLITREDNE